MSRPNLAFTSFQSSAVFFLFSRSSAHDHRCQRFRFATLQSRLCIPDLREVEAFEPSQSRVNNRRIRADPTRRRRGRSGGLVAHAHCRVKGNDAARSVNSRQDL
ncbi:unnamed protein product [Ixodes pacificus]